MDSEKKRDETKNNPLNQDELRRKLSSALVNYLDETGGTVRWYSAYEGRDNARYADIHFDPELEGFHWALTIYTKKLARYENKERLLYEVLAREQGEQDFDRDDVFQSPHRSPRRFIYLVIGFECPRGRFTKQPENLLSH